MKEEDFFRKKNEYRESSTGTKNIYGDTKTAYTCNMKVRKRRRKKNRSKMKEVVPFLKPKGEVKMQQEEKE